MNRMLKNEIEHVIVANTNLFASADMPRINLDFMCHKVAILPQSKPVAQIKWKLGKERRVVVAHKVNQLLKADFIRPIKYTTWIANVVMVKKSSGKWRMCMDYNDLNKACPKDTYPLSNIDWLVGNTAGYELFSFLDAYSGYNQCS